MCVSRGSGQTHLEAKCYHLLTVVAALPNLRFVTCFFYMTSSFRLDMNQTVSKVFTWFGLHDSTAINISKKEDNLGFKRFD